MRRAALLLALLCAGLARAQDIPPEQLFQEAQLAQQIGNFNLAAEKYQLLLQSHPDNIAARANLAVALSALGRYDEAIQQYTAALKLAPGNPGLRFNLALAYYKSNHLTEAASLFSGLLEADPHNERIALLLADCEMRLGRNEEVIALLLPFETSDASNLAVAWTLGSAMIRAGQVAEGVVLIEKVAQGKASPEAFSMAADAYLKLERYSDAQRCVSEAERLNPDYPGIYTLDGIVKEYAGDTDAAEAAFRKAIAINSKDFEAHLRLGALLFRARRLEDARAQLEAALQLDPKSAFARFQLAKAQNALGLNAEALQNLETVTRELPQWLPPHIELAALYYRMKRPEDGAREKQIVDRLTEEERQKQTQTKIISPKLLSQ